MKQYATSKDSKSGLWYAHQKGLSYIPSAGSVSEKKSDAIEYAKMYNLLPNKVEEIEQKKKEKFEKEMIMTEYEERWIQSMLS